MTLYREILGVLGHLVENRPDLVRALVLVASEADRVLVRCGKFGAARKGKPQEAPEGHCIIMKRRALPDAFISAALVRAAENGHHRVVKQLRAVPEAADPRQTSAGPFGRSAAPASAANLIGALGPGAPQLSVPGRRALCERCGRGAGAQAAYRQPVHPGTQAREVRLVNLDLPVK
jgi:hypothetical protein